MIELAIAACILLSLPAFVVVQRPVLRLAGLRRQLREAIEEAEFDHAEMIAQTSLEHHLDMLRDKLRALGAPRLHGDQLYFGDALINGDQAIVDEVRRLCGGTATIFAGERRVATTIFNADGSRAIGTSLARGPAFHRVLEDGMTYRGVSEVCGETYLTVYEPILASGVMIGMIAAGVARGERTAAGGSKAVSIAGLKAALQAQAETLNRSLAALRENQDRVRCAS